MPRKGLKEFIKRVPPVNIKPGDYVELDGMQVKNLFNVNEVLTLMKKTMNILYILKIQNGMATLSIRRGSTYPTIQVPIKCIKNKLKNVQE